MKIISDELKKSKDCKKLRKEIKTKFELLREDDDADMDDDIIAVPIPIVQFVVTRFPAMMIGQVELITVDIPSLQISGLQIPGLQYVYLDILALDPEVLRALGAVVPVVDSKGAAVVIMKIRDEKFVALMKLWEKRYSKILDFWDDQGNKIVPMPGSALWYERKAVIAAVEAGGDYDALWDAYNEKMQRAVGRRINLKRKR